MTKNKTGELGGDMAKQAPKPQTGQWGLVKKGLPIIAETAETSGTGQQMELDHHSTQSSSQGRLLQAQSYVSCSGIAKRF